MEKQFEEERQKTFEMQNEMVCDMEKLILNLEREKKELETDLKLSKNERAISDIEFESRFKKVREALSNAERENGVLLQELNNLKEIFSEGLDKESSKVVEELTRQNKELKLKLYECEKVLQEREDNFNEELVNEKVNFEKRLGLLRKDLREEMDILEQQKDDIRQEMRWEVERVAAEWAARLESSEKERTAQLMEEKARFGRVLVGKNDEYDKLVEEKKVEIEGVKRK